VKRIEKMGSHGMPISLAPVTAVKFYSFLQFKFWSKKVLDCFIMVLNRCSRYSKG